MSRGCEGGVQESPCAQVPLPGRSAELGESSCAFAGTGPRASVRTLPLGGPAALAVGLWALEGSGVHLHKGKWTSQITGRVGKAPSRLWVPLRPPFPGLLELSVQMPRRSGEPRALSPRWGEP